MLADWPERQDLTCFDLMYLESEAVIRTMLRLKRELGVVCLSVTTASSSGEPGGAAAAILKDEYRRVIGVEPALKVNRPDGSVEIVSTSAWARGAESAPRDWDYKSVRDTEAIFVPAIPNTAVLGRSTAADVAL